MIKIRAEALLLASLALVYGALESCGPPEPSISLGVSNGVSRPPRCFDAGASIQVGSVSVPYKDCTTAQERVALDFRHEILLPEDVFHGCYPLPPSAFQRSLVNWHNPRLRSVIRRIRSGLPITIVTLGGSVAYGNEAGGPLFASSHWFVRWLQQRYPKAIVTHHNLARGATDSIWILANFDMISRYQPHLILYDYSTNDISSTAGLEPSKMRSITEAVVRTLFSLPSSPALIQLVIFRSPRQGRDSMLLEIETKGIEPVAKYYNYTLISYRNAVWPALDSPPSGGVIEFKKTHPMW